MSSLQDSITYKGKRVVFKNMALYALGDMHLSFMAHKPMDKFGKVWKNHEEKIEQIESAMDSIEENVDDIVNDPEVQEAYEGYKDSLKQLFGGE